MNNLEYVVAGYLLTAGALAAYVMGLRVRAKRARGRAEAIVERGRLEPT